MKKLFVIFTIIMTLPSYATTMCAENNTVAIVLDPSLPIKGNSYNKTLYTWEAWGDYGAVYGSAACLNSDKGKSRGGTVAQLKDDRDGDGIDEYVVSGGEKYGKYCWCKLTHPASSLWTFNRIGGYYGNVENCASDCVEICSDLVKTNADFRAALFGSIGQ